MTAKPVPVLAGLIHIHKEKSHILETVLERSLQETKHGSDGQDHCPTLSDAIGHLRPDQLRRQSIPEAISELAEIHTMVEGSVDQIMSKAEKLMECEGAMDDAITILEACSFQDIIGQRMAKVTELLENLEERFHSLVHETGVQDNLGSMGEEELEEEQRRKELILHGPQLTGDGVSQDEIDALLGA